MTFLELITSAYRKLGIAGEGETIGAGMVSDAKEALNLMLEEWENDPDIALTEEQSFYSAASTASYTIGTGQTWVGNKPLEVESAYITISSTDYPLTVITEKEYMEISDKATTGTPEYIMYIAAEETGRVYLYPVPTARYAVVLLSKKPFVQCSSLTASVTLPKGYKSAIVYNLAIALSVEYEVDIKQLVATKAVETLDLIRSSNKKRPIPVKFTYYNRGRSVFNINTGY